MFSHAAQLPTLGTDRLVLRALTPADVPAQFAIFGELGLHRVEADVDPRNDRSIRALERAGFVREGHQRERYRQAGEWQDAVLYGLLGRDWIGAQASGLSSGR